MRAVIVSESEFGATRLVAEAIEIGLGGMLTTELVDIHDVGTRSFGPDDVVVVGAPTRGRMLRAGVREWLAELHLENRRCAAFTTRAAIPRILSGSAGRAIRRGLRRAGGREIAPPASFLIDQAGAVAPGELVRAREWGRRLATSTVDGNVPYLD